MLNCFSVGFYSAQRSIFMIYLFENMSYNSLLGVVIKEGNEFKLTKIQNKLLKYLLDNPQKVLSKQVLMEQVWQRTVTENSVDQRIANLRSIIEEDRKNPRIIATSFGQGIILDCDVQIEGQVDTTNNSVSQHRKFSKNYIPYLSVLTALLVLSFFIYWTQFKDVSNDTKARQPLSKQSYLNQFSVDKRQSVDDMFAGLPLKVRKKFRRYLSGVSDAQKKAVTLELLEMTEAERVKYILAL